MMWQLNKLFGINFVMRSQFSLLPPWWTDLDWDALMNFNSRGFRSMHEIDTFGPGDLTHRNWWKLNNEMCIFDLYELVCKPSSHSQIIEWNCFVLWISWKSLFISSWKCVADVISTVSLRSLACLFRPDDYISQSWTHIAQNRLSTTIFKYFQVSSLFVLTSSIQKNSIKCHENLWWSLHWRAQSIIQYGHNRRIRSKCRCIL